MYVPVASYFKSASGLQWAMLKVDDDIRDLTENETCRNADFVFVPRSTLGH